MSWSLVAAAFGVGVVHTLLGPDHYLPFIMLARARGWSRLRTVLVTSACGLGHVASSVILGGLGIVLGVAIGRLETVEGGRGSIAAWAIVAFGIAYALWGLRHALRKRTGLEAHVHDGDVHIHSHGLSPHGHDHHRVGANTTFWTLFIIFVLGPCEPLIPLFALPASQGRWDVAALTAVVFGVATLLSMVGATLAGYEGLKLVRLGPLERWSHVVAGCVIAAAGLSVIYLGL
ncbi:MAG: sulfite exporter TauE/SafE family protein [Acidobacteria bacterium]|nr:sulfite exporter TauE/SafE family protein [Candidatus Sulfomarinibacter sp. MAG AM1]